jgi:hypothetical protein
VGNFFITIFKRVNRISLLSSVCWNNVLEQGTDLADKTALGRLFQSLIVAGKKEL